jgi:hypothetical protein
MFTVGKIPGVLVVESVLLVGPSLATTGRDPQRTPVAWARRSESDPLAARKVIHLEA